MTTQQDVRPKFKYYKAVTPEASVNTKSRFDKNGIEWVEDITYRNTGNFAYFLKIPIDMVNKPSGCKRMFFLKYYPGPNDEFISDTDAAMFYTTMYPRYMHVAKIIIDKNAILKSWKDLDEETKQKFTKTWGKYILHTIYNMARWKLNNTEMTRPYNLYEKPTDVNEDNIDIYLEDIEKSNRTTIIISCDDKLLNSIYSMLSFESPTIYTLDENKCLTM